MRVVYSGYEVAKDSLEKVWGLVLFQEKGGQESCISISVYANFITRQFLLQVVTALAFISSHLFLAEFEDFSVVIII